MNSAQQLPGVAPLSPEHARALDRFDDIVRRPDLAHSLWLEPGDVQIINSHVTLHSRTEFIDHEEPARKRLLYRLWLAPPDSERLPESWRSLYGQSSQRRCAAGSADTSTTSAARRSSSVRRAISA